MRPSTTKRYQDLQQHAAQLREENARLTTESSSSAPKLREALEKVTAEIRERDRLERLRLASALKLPINANLERIASAKLAAYREVLDLLTEAALRDSEGE